MSRTDQAWASDNTDAADRMWIQYGYGQVYPARTMGSWVTDVPNQLTGRTVPLRFRFHVAMAGTLGIGGDLTRWSEDGLREGAARRLVQHGRLDRLSPPCDDTPSVPDATETLPLAWRRTSRHGSPQPPVRLRGLTPQSRYRDARTGAVHHAAVLTEYGMHLALPPGDWSSAAVHLIRETEG
ncbi:alpha-galactosidase [Streptomyces sp. NPDC127172]|uniref:alpha-galactosidase n=1 Tax=Streptomyces sp. NPDC127172 TaxID=3345382 RepID=UPI00363DE30E